ncbi:hypothetical protein [Massilia consociata]|uniref:hypothetical protein n=1 Tax=Massilia consociata TaxID=760117 RepID=UPI0036D22E5C
MKTFETGRRTRRAPCVADRVTEAMPDAIRQGVLLQTCCGTLGAVEYLKAHDVASRVIHRVLSDGFVRVEGDARPAGAVV